VFLGGYFLFTFCSRMYHLATMQLDRQTDGQTDNRIMPTAKNRKENTHDD